MSPDDLRAALLIAFAAALRAAADVLDPIDEDAAEPVDPFPTFGSGA